MRASLIVVGLLVAGAAEAQTLDERFEQANGKYFQKDYRGAREDYAELVDRWGVDDPVVHFNRGNANYLLGEWGRAILHYKRALEAGPDEGLEARVRDNMERCVEALLDRHRRDVGSVTVLDETHGVAWSLFHLLSADVTSGLLLGVWSLFFLALAGRRLVDDAARRRKLGLAALWLAVPLMLAVTMYLGRRVTSQAVVRAVVVESNVQVREGRHPDAPATDVPEGLEVRIVDRTDPEETRIRLSNGREGWVPANAVEPI